MLGIFITGPLGAIAGAACGIWHELRGTGGTASSAAARWVRPALRGGAGFVAGLLLLDGVAGLARGEYHGGAAAIVMAVVPGWWAWTGRWPGWFRRGAGIGEQWAGNGGTAPPASGLLS